LSPSIATLIFPAALVFRSARAVANGASVAVPSALSSLPRASDTLWYCATRVVWMGLALPKTVSNSGTPLSSILAASSGEGTSAASFLA
jgi:hypothetical protein